MGDNYTYEDLKMYWNWDIAKTTLDALSDKIRACQRGSAHNRRRGFDNDDVILMIKLWKKATEVRMGYTPGDWVYYRFKHEPAKLAGNQKRSDVLWNAVVDFEVNLDNRDLYRRASEAMLNFVWDFHRKITDVDQDTDFISKLNMVISAGLTGLANEYLPRGNGHPGKV